MDSEKYASVKIMLKEALTTLCSSIIDYELNLKIDALIVVTVDQKDVIVTNINENVENAIEAEKHAHCESSELTPVKKSANVIIEADEHWEEVENENEVKSEPHSIMEIETDLNNDETCAEAIPHVTEYVTKYRSDKQIPGETAKDGSSESEPKRRNSRQYLVCGKCKTQFLNRKELFDHLQSHHNSGLECRECGKKFVSPSGLRFHLKKHKGAFNFICSICDKKFLLKGNYISHMNGHTGEKPYKCDACNKSYQFKTSLHHHKISGCKMKESSVDEGSVCDECGAYFTQKRFLKEHVDGLHREARYKCGCGKKYRWRASMKAHRVKCPHAPKEKDS